MNYPISSCTRLRQKSVGRKVYSAMLMMTGLTLFNHPSEAFTIQVPGPGDSGGCADLINQPQQYRRLRSGTNTFRITQNFMDRYPDDFSQYLVQDSARLLTDFMGTQRYNWIDDIQHREHYFKLNYDHNYYGLKGILLHEFSHALGMQHNDGCYYNINQATGDPWLSNYELIGGGNVAVVEPTGFEIMMEAPMADFITPDIDVFDFFSYAYPFQQVNFVHTNSQNQVIRVDSTDADSHGGQLSVNDTQAIDPNDESQGWYINSANLWVGYDNFILYDQNVWYIENTSGHDINQVSMRINGTSTRKPFLEEAPDDFTHLGTSTTSSPEQLIYSWSTPPGQYWPAPDGIVGIPGGNPNTEPPRFILELDAYHTTVQEVLLWHHSNEAFEVVFPTVQSIMPWQFTPNTPPIESAPPYALASLPLSEPSPVPDDIELQSIHEPPVPSGRRGFRLVVPRVDQTTFQHIDLLHLTWREAEILMHQPSQLRSKNLSRKFFENSDQVHPILDPNAHHTLRSIGFRKDLTQFIQDPRAERTQRTPLSKFFTVDLDDQHTYATRVVVSSPAGLVYHYSMPEMNRYMGTRKARCAISGDPESCCPYEMRDPVMVEHSWRSENLTESSCVVGSKLADDIILNGRLPHLLATGSGDDKVQVVRSESSVQLGAGNDYFSTATEVLAHVDGGPGQDTLHGSDQNDHMLGGDGADTLMAAAGDDVLWGGAGNDHIISGSGNDTIYPGQGKDQVNAGPGDDRVIFTQACELELGAVLVGGSGHDTLYLPISLEQAETWGLIHSGFEQVHELVVRDSVIPNCD